MIALVLPLSACSGSEWEGVRKAFAGKCRDITVVTIAGAGSYAASFSADTGMAECLILARRSEQQGELRATFVMLRQGVWSTAEADLLAAEITRIRESAQLRTVESMQGESSIRIGEQDYGFILDAPLPETGPWPLVGIADGELAQVAWNLERGALVQPGLPNVESISLSIVPIQQIASRGPYHADIYWDQPDGTPRGPFQLIKPSVSPVPTYPIIWAHDAKRERGLVVEPDSEGQIKSASAGMARDQLLENAADIWATATRAHYNRDLRFNSQSLIVAMTGRPSIGGQAWPSVIFRNSEHEYVFSLWCNSTLGLLMHWWVANKTQSGRGRTTVTSIPNIPTLDVRTLTSEHLVKAKAAFEELRERRFLPFDQIDEDTARAELDRRLLVEVLGLPETLCDPGGPIDLIRRKLAQEPQVHGAKQTRVVFYEMVDDVGNAVIQERSQQRQDR